MDGYRELMISVLATQIKDYISIVPALSKAAEGYIFDDSRKAQKYVFSFVNICKHIELDPGKFRKKIKLLRIEKKIIPNL